MSRVHWIARLTGSPTWRWSDRGGSLARLRRWCWHTIARYDSETCDACGRRVDLAWMVDDPTIWKRAYAEATNTEAAERDEEQAGGLLCPACFDTAAERVGIRLLWRPSVF